MNKSVIITLIVAALVIGLFVWGNITQKNNIVYFQDTEVACLTHGHQRIAEHIHPRLEITVDGKPEQIPANIGIIRGCMSEIHTHDSSGTIHVESSLEGRIGDFNLEHFFSVWAKDHIRDGYDLKIIQDGVMKESIRDIKFIDHSVIELHYTSKDSGGEVQDAI